MVCMSRIDLNMLAQSIEDILRYELGMPLTGIANSEEREEAYEDALCYISQFPSLRTRFTHVNHKEQWLKELEDARY